MKRFFGEPNPILVRELRATFRTGLYIHFLWIVTALVAVIVIFGGAIVASSPVAPAQVGQTVFAIFFYGALCVIVLVAPAYASTAITTERESRTFESLILSGMTPNQIIWGKFAACFASIGLVLISLAPVVGVAFLFGGISPWHVLFGYAGLLVLTANAISFGLAISARIPSTRVAIIVALFIYVMAAFFVIPSFSVFAEPATSAWGTSAMGGTWWFTDALATRFFHWDTFACAVLIPLFVFGMPTWLFLASAVAALRPPAEDRSTPFKWWAIVLVLGCAVTAAVAVALTPTSGHDRGQLTVALQLAVGAFASYLVLVFINEPPLPPRLVELRRPTMGVFRRTLLVVGPGAAPTLRFATLLLVVFPLLVAAPCAFLHHWDGATITAPDYTDAALLVIVIGQTAVVLAFLAFGTWLRLVTQNGIASRALVVVAFVAAIAVPLLAQLVIDPDFVDHANRGVPFMLRLSPIGPAWLAIAMTDSADKLELAPGIVVPTLLYGLVALLFTVLVEARVVSVRRAVATWRVQREERVKRVAEQRAQEAAARQSIPSNPPLETVVAKVVSDAGPVDPDPKPALPVSETKTSGGSEGEP